MRCLFIGLDAFDPDVLQEGVRRGDFPALARLKSRSRLFETTTDPGTYVGSLWATVHTGVDPSQHGLYCWADLEPGTYRVRLSDERHIDGGFVLDPDFARGPSLCGHRRPALQARSGYQRPSCHQLDDALQDRRGVCDHASRSRRRACASVRARSVSSLQRHRPQSGSACRFRRRAALACVLANRIRSGADCKRRFRSGGGHLWRRSLRRPPVLSSAPDSAVFGRRPGRPHLSRNRSRYRPASGRLSRRLRNRPARESRHGPASRWQPLAERLVRKSIVALDVARTVPLGRRLLRSCRGQSDAQVSRAGGAAVAARAAAQRALSRLRGAEQRGRDWRPRQSARP